MNTFNKLSLSSAIIALFCFNTAQAAVNNGGDAPRCRGSQKASVEVTCTFSNGKTLNLSFEQKFFCGIGIDKSAPSFGTEDPTNLRLSAEGQAYLVEATEETSVSASGPGAQKYIRINCKAGTRCAGNNIFNVGKNIVFEEEVVLAQDVFGIISSYPGEVTSRCVGRTTSVN